MNGLNYKQKEFAITRGLTRNPEALIEALSVDSSLRYQFLGSHKEFPNLNQSNPRLKTSKYSSYDKTLNNIWCRYHKSNCHSDAQCPAWQTVKRTQTVFPSKNHDLTPKPKPSFYMKEQYSLMPQPRLDATINKSHCECILDTGPRYNLVPEKMFHKLNLIPSKLPRPITLVAINGTTFEVKEKCKTNIIFDSKNPVPFEIELLRSSTDHGELILGIEFFNQKNTLIDLIQKNLILKNILIPFSNHNGNEIDEIIIDRSTCLFTHQPTLSESHLAYLDQSKTIGCIYNLFYQIPLCNTKPISSKPYPMPYALLKPTKQEVERLLTMGIIRQSTSIYSSPAFPLVKKDGSIRLVVDYRKLNERTNKTGYPFPKIRDQLRQLNNATIFSQLDMNCVL